MQRRLARFIVAFAACALCMPPLFAANAAKTRDFAKRAMAATGFTLGRAGPLIVSFEDPNCMFCERLSRETAPLVQAGKLRVRVVPVAFLKPDSLGRAAAILQARHPAAAWERNMAQFHHAQEEGGYPVASVTFTSDRALRANRALLEQGSGQLATPTLLICAKGSDTPVLRSGISSQALHSLLQGAGSVTPSGGCSAASP